MLLLLFSLLSLHQWGFVCIISSSTFFCCSWTNVRSVAFCFMTCWMCSFCLFLALLCFHGLYLYIPLFFFDFVDAFLHLSFCVVVLLFYNVLIHEELLKTDTFFVIVIDHFLLCHCFLGEPVRLIHLINNMYHNVVIWYLYFLFCQLCLCLINLFEV